MRFVIGIVVAGLAAVAAAQPQYEVVDLTKQFGEELTAVDINNNGDVVGHFRLSSTEYQACVISNGKLTMLPRYQGIHDWYATDINDNGDVLGAGNVGEPWVSTLLFRNGKVIDTGIEGFIDFPGGIAINNLGQITGGRHGTPFIWENGVLTLIPGAGGGVDISDAQTIVGGTGSEARMWRQGQYINLNPPWSDDSLAVSVNELDEAAGYAWAISGGQHGVLWRDGKAIDLGDFGGGQSRAYDVNDLSQVVGWGADPGGIIRGFLWEDGTMYDLTQHIGKHPGFLWLETAIAVNNQGQILSSAAGGPQLGHELLLNPVPEPSSALIIAMGICVIAISRRKVWRG